MSLNSVNTNIAATVALASLNSTVTQLQATEKKISTGFRVADAVDDGAAYAVAQRVRSDVGALTSANEQLGNVKGILSTTNSALNNISNTLNKARDVLVKISDTNTSGTQRTAYITQYKALVSNIQSFIKEATYNGRSLVNSYATTAGGYGAVSIISNEVGGRHKLSNFAASAIYKSIASYTTGNFTAAATIKGAITAGGTFIKQITSIGTQLNYYGSQTNYVDSQVSYNTDKIDSLNNGLGALIDADLAKESAKLQSLQIRQQLGTQSLSIANQSPQSLLSLFK